MAGCRGLLIRGGDVLEAASHTDTVIFDKTGTLTRGKPSIRSITPATSDLSEQDILAYAACVERQTSHPVAHAIVSASDAQGGSSLKKHQHLAMSPACHPSSSVHSQPCSTALTAGRALTRHSDSDWAKVGMQAPEHLQT